MKLLKNAYFQFALMAAIPFVALAVMNGFVPAPMAVTAVADTAWYAPWTWGNQEVADSVTEAVNRVNAANHAQGVIWAVRCAMAAAVVAALAKVFEMKKLRDPRTVESALEALSRFSKQHNLLQEEEEEQEQILAKQQKPAAKTSANRPLPTSAVTA